MTGKAKEIEDFNTYEDSVIDVDEVEGVDIKVNPAYYLHLGLIRAQGCLMKEDMKQGFLQYVVLVENCEVLAKAMNLLDEKNYTDPLKEFKDSDEFKDEEGFNRNVKLANKKYGLISAQFFASQVSTKPLKG